MTNKLNTFQLENNNKTVIKQNFINIFNFKYHMIIYRNFQYF